MKTRPDEFEISDAYTIVVRPRIGGHDTDRTGHCSQWEFSSDDPEVRRRMEQLPELWPGRRTGITAFHLLQGPKDTPEALARAVARVLVAAVWMPELLQDLCNVMLEYHAQLGERWVSSLYDRIECARCQVWPAIAIAAEKLPWSAAEQEQFELGVRVPTREQLETLAQLSGVTLDWLLHGDQRNDDDA